jgi:hypothetical protein
MYQRITRTTKLLEYACYTFKHSFTQKILSSPVKPSCTPTHIRRYIHHKLEAFVTTCLHIRVSGGTAQIAEVAWRRTEKENMDVNARYRKLRWSISANHLNHLPVLRIKIQCQRNKSIVRVHRCLFYESYQTHKYHERHSFLTFYSLRVT